MSTGAPWQGATVHYVAESLHFEPCFNCRYLFTQRYRVVVQGILSGPSFREVLGCPDCRTIQRTLKVFNRAAVIGRRN